MKSDNLLEKLLEQHGPLMTGENLYKALGYKSWAGFAKAVRSGAVEVDIFNLPGRKGRYAKTSDVANWINKLNKNSNGGAP
jgi:hypothetical protein